VEHAAAVVEVSHEIRVLLQIDDSPVEQRFRETRVEDHEAVVVELGDFTVGQDRGVSPGEGQQFMDAGELLGGPDQGLTDSEGGGHDGLLTRSTSTPNTRTRFPTSMPLQEQCAL